MRRWLQTTLERAWYQPKVSWTLIFLPLALLFWLLSSIRRLSYRYGLIKPNRVNKPVIVVGNISVGGNGKTPLVIYLCQLLQAHGFKPGIISRGYGAKQRQVPYRVSRQDDAGRVGDEPLLLAKRTQCPVVIDPKRPRAAAYLIHHTDCDVIISDDGLQHYALQRDVEIAVLDGHRLCGNNWLLPVGPLRELRSRLNTVDFLVLNASVAQDAYTMQYKPDSLVNLTDASLIKTADSFAGKTVHAVAAIADPSRFFVSLKNLGMTIIPHRFPDHYIFSANDLHFDDDHPIIMTEKDAVKCEQFAAYHCWYLPITAFLPDNFDKACLNKLKELHHAER